tara:strand:+ start:85 stop:330 length:246 start_codon:yes stop_codon:yes gene_type:complete
MKKSELRKIIKEEISEINYRETEFTRNIPARIDQFIDKLDDLIDEYHAELYLKDGVFTGMEAVKSAALGPDTAKDPEEDLM